MTKKKVAKKSTAKRSLPKVSFTKQASKKKVAKKKAVKKKAVKKSHGSCFVMMPFKEPFNIYYENIFKPAIKSAQFDAVRADDLFRPSVIVSDLWQMIQDAEVLLAELTTKNANVFYELGLAHAIGKPVILVSETMDDVPFDLQQLRVLLYDKDDPAWGGKLAQGIKSSLEETITSPVESVPSIFRKKVKSQAPTQDATVARIEALERQMRFLDSPIKSSKLRRSAAEFELQDISSSKDLAIWARKWLKRGHSVSQLERMVITSESIPPDEEEVIAKAFKNMFE